MQGIGIFLLLVFVHQAVSRSYIHPNVTYLDPLSPEITDNGDENVNVIDLHGNHTCPDQTFPRVTNSRRCGKSKSARPMVQCVTCVREGVDAICMGNGYLRAFLTFRKSPFRCHLATNRYVKEEDKTKCPLGAKCVGMPDSVDHGVCCYGKPTLTDSGWTFNVDRKCDKCGNDCVPPLQCLADVSPCGSMIHTCQSPRLFVEKGQPCLNRDETKP